MVSKQECIQYSNRNKSSKLDHNLTTSLSPEPNNPPAAGAGVDPNPEGAGAPNNPPDGAGAGAPNSPPPDGAGAAAEGAPKENAMVAFGRCGLIDAASSLVCVLCSC